MSRSLPCLSCEEMDHSFQAISIHPAELHDVVNLFVTNTYFSEGSDDRSVIVNFSSLDFAASVQNNC